MQTARQLADLVQIARREAWDKADPTSAILATQKLSTADESAIRQTVAEAGYSGDELESMAKHVSQLLVGKVEALADDMPATGGD